MFDFDTMRDWLSRQPADPKVKRARLALFDRYRYSENYEALYDFIKELGGNVE